MPRRAVPASAPRPSSPPATPTATPPQPPHVAGRRRADVAGASVEEERGRPLALTVNPLGVALGRLSSNAEALLAPHHALVISPNVLLFEVGRGGRYNLISEGFGYATQTSTSYGIELGYHYWLRARRSLRGTFLGPSLLVGTTTDPSVAEPPSRAQGYWGFAFDAGLQEVMPVGFTIGGGIGLGVLRLGDATAVFPRLLLQTGWSL
jgi:hypothetical protein